MTGFVVEPGRADLLGARIAELLADPGYARAMGVAGRARARDRFSRERMATDTAALYERLSPV